MTIGTSPSVDTDPTIGQVLAAARAASKLSLEEVSAETRVRVPIIHAIEQDDFTRCGGDFYARGHIRAIARAVGTDGDALVARYDAAHGGDPADARPVAPLFDTERIRSSERRRPNWTAAMVAAIVVVIAVIGVNLMSGKSGDSSAQAAPPASASPSSGIGPVLKPSPTATAAAPSSAIAAAPAGKVTVKLSAETAASWLSVKDSKGKTLFQGNLDKGQSQTFTDDKKLRIILGNAGGVHLWVNGKDLGTAGNDGQVTRLTYTPGNPQAG
ncbi:helix-turn-helix domain-containing protein [Streptacidiphilus monticola]|uniref:Helix-turn-helix domain-containing protein n=1 Tax=Streptacidiphilus monticola TaxID=2161674 RepID=A0ABW1G2Z6_9ACTN